MNWVLVVVALLCVFLLSRVRASRRITVAAVILAAACGLAVLAQLQALTQLPSPATPDETAALRRTVFVTSSEHVWIRDRSGDLMVLDRATLSPQTKMTWASPFLEEFATDGENLLLVSGHPETESSTWALAGPRGWIVAPAETAAWPRGRLTVTYEPKSASFLVIELPDTVVPFAQLNVERVVVKDGRAQRRSETWSIEVDRSLAYMAACPSANGLVLLPRHFGTKGVDLDLSGARPRATTINAKDRACPTSINTYPIGATTRDVTPKGLVTPRVASGTEQGEVYSIRGVRFHLGEGAGPERHMVGFAAGDALLTFTGVDASAWVFSLTASMATAHGLPPADFLEVRVLRGEAEQSLFVPTRDLGLLSDVLLLDDRTVIFGHGARAVFDRDGVRIDRAPLMKQLRNYTSPWGGHSILFEVWTALACGLWLLSLLALLTLRRPRRWVQIAVTIIAFVEVNALWSLVERVHHL